MNPPADNLSAQHPQHAQRAQRHAQFEPMLRSSPQLQQVLQGVATVAQMTLLQPVSQAQATAPSSSSSAVQFGSDPQAQATVHLSSSSPVQSGSHTHTVEKSKAAGAMQDGQPQIADATGTAEAMQDGSGSHPQAVNAAQAAEAMQDGHESSTDAEGSLCVVNSHLFFHPQASHVRNIHTAALMSEVQDFISATRGSLSTSQQAQTDVLAGQSLL